MTHPLRTKLAGRLLVVALPLALLALPAATAADPPAAGAKTAAPAKPAAARRYTIDQFLKNTTYLGTSFSPDGGKILVGSNQTGVVNAFAIPVAGGAPVQLTDSKVSAIVPLTYFPNDERFLYTSDQGGNERNHLYVQSPDGKVRDLTPGDKLKAAYVDWKHDRKSFFYTSNERNPNAMDLYEMPIDTFEPRRLFETPEGREIQSVSPDGRYVALSVARTSTDSDVYLHDRQSGETKLITPKAAGAGEIANRAETFTPNSDALLYATDQGSEFSYLLRYDLATGKSSEIVRAPWDVAFAIYSEDDGRLVVGINNDARTELRMFDAATLKPLSVPAMQGADVTGLAFSRDGKRLAFYAESAAPRNLFVQDLASGKIDQLTQSLNPEIDPNDLVAAEVVRFKSYDGTEVPGLLYRPKGASAGDKVPALVSVHGGPGGQTRVGYSALTQFLVNQGYAVYGINNRGSSGYGKTFFAMDDRKHGDADLDDCVASKKMLAATGWIDGGRIGILGGSYGGYMVLAALAFRPAEFQVGIDIYGVSNWLRTLQSIPAWWGPMRESLFKEMGDPAADEAYLRKISPLFHADKIERPLIVLQGANDPRVLKVESDEIVAAAKKRGVPVEYVIFPDEGHGFVKKANQITGFKAILDFLDIHLKK